MSSAELHAQIASANTKFEGYFNENDMKALASLYTEDATVMPPASDTVTGRDAIAELFGKVRSQMARIKLTIVEVGVVHTDSVVYERSHYSFYNEKGDEMDNGKYIVIWKKVDGEWKLYSDIFNTSKSA